MVHDFGVQDHCDIRFQTLQQERAANGRPITVRDGLRDKQKHFGFAAGYQSIKMVSKAWLMAIDHSRNTVIIACFDWRRFRRLMQIGTKARPSQRRLLAAADRRILPKNRKSDIPFALCRFRR
jgi:hypothetical protein